MSDQLREQLQAAFKAQQDTNKETIDDDATDSVDDVVDDRQKDKETEENGQSKEVVTNVTNEAENKGETQVQEPVKAVVDAPVSLSGAIKEKWATLPEDVQREWKKREDDFHRAMTANDGELRMGRTIKEIASPYMATIQAEGGTVEGAFKDLLNTAYILRTGSQHQKAAILMQAAQQFGVDIGGYVQQSQQNPHFTQLSQLQDEIHRLKQAQTQSPQIIEQELQKRLEEAKIDDEIRSFAANPKNSHFETVRADMGALMSSGRAKDLQEAYEMACWANPSIRQANLAAQEAAEKAKRKEEMESKRKASSSVAGSPSGASPSAGEKAQLSLRDQIRQSLEAQMNSDRI